MFSLVKANKIFISAVFLFVIMFLLESNCCLVYGAKPDPYAPVDTGVPEGCMLIEGDIIVPIVSTRATFGTNWWPGGIVPYIFSSNVSPTNRSLMLDAMSEWEAVANVNFVPMSGHFNFLFIQNSTVNNSWSGVQGGMQEVNIASWGTKFTIVHELGHALGYWHEQSRLDRDTYVIIEWDNIPEDDEHNFNKEIGTFVYGAYDFDSVMHYGQCAFSSCGNTVCGANPVTCRTITVKPPWDTAWQNSIGQLNHLSDLDAITMSLMYPESGTVFVDKSYSGSFELGTFFSPFKTFNLGASAVPSYGTVVIQPGSYNETGLYTKAMTLKAPIGGVVLGQ